MDREQYISAWLAGFQATREGFNAECLLTWVAGPGSLIWRDADTYTVAELRERPEVMALATAAADAAVWVLA